MSLLENIKILVVDDSEDIRAVLTLMSRKIAGVAVSEAENGEEALKAFEKEPYDIVLMDLMMPVMDGFEATKRIKSLYPKTVIVVITAVIDSAIENQILRIGATAYIRKPIKNPRFTRTRIENFVNYAMVLKHAIGDRFCDDQTPMNPLASSIRSMKTFATIVKEDDLMDIMLWVTERYIERHSIAVRGVFGLIHAEVMKAIKQHIPTAIYMEEDFDWLYLSVQITEPFDVEKLDKEYKLLIGEYVRFDNEYLYVKIRANEDISGANAIEMAAKPLKIAEPLEIAEPPKVEPKIEPKIEKPIAPPIAAITPAKTEPIEPIAADRASRVASVEEQGMLRKNYAEKLSAAEYARTLSSMDFETVQDMEEAEHELDERLREIDEEFAVGDAKRLGAIFQRYAGIVSQLYEFVPFSYALSSLGALLDGIDEASMARLNAALARTLLHGIHDDIKKWRDTIFVTKSTADVHYLDASLLSSCMQIESLLLNQDVTAGDDSGEMELF